MKPVELAVVGFLRERGYVVDVSLVLCMSTPSRRSGWRGWWDVRGGGVSGAVRFIPGGLLFCPPRYVPFLGLVPDWGRLVSVSLCDPELFVRLGDVFPSRTLV